MTTDARRDRYPGARPFSGDRLDRRLFFGREDETNDLFHRIQASQLLVLFGKSGIGKTSLLQAGVLPKLRENEFLPLNLRLNQQVDSVVDYVMSAIEAQCAAESIDYTPGEPGSLWEFFKTAVFWRGDELLTPILVLDQFEEIFTLQTARARKAIATELGQLFSERIPAAIRERIGSDAVTTYREQAPNVKILVCLRDEFLGSLQALASYIPGILDDRFRLAPLHAKAARKAVIEPASLPQENRFTTPRFRYSDSTLDKLLQFLTGKSDEAEPFQLQVLCHYVERQVAKSEQEEPIIVSENFLGDRRQMQRVLQNFYADAIKLLPSKHQRRRARRLCEEGLLSTDGRRLSLEQQQITRQYDIAETTLHALLDSRILRRESRLDSYYYELSHDSLARSIADNRGWRMPKWLVAAMVVIAALMLLFGILYVVTLEQRQKAETAALEAQQAREEAERILNFLTFDLRDKLEPIGRLDIVEDVQSVVDDYYRRTPVDSTDALAIHRRASSHTNKGNRFVSQGKLNAALKEHRKSFALKKKAAELEPDNPLWQRALSVSYNNIGDIQEARGKLDAALDAYQKDLQIAERLANDDPSNAGWQRDLSYSFTTIGDLFKEKGDLAGALSRYKSSLKIDQRLFEMDPSNLEWQLAYVISLWRIAEIVDTSQEKGQVEATDNLSAALGILRKLDSKKLLTDDKRSWISQIEEDLDRFQNGKLN